VLEPGQDLDAHLGRVGPELGQTILDQGLEGGGEPTVEVRGGDQVVEAELPRAGNHRERGGEVRRSVVDGVEKVDMEVDHDGDGTFRIDMTIE